MGTPVDNAAAKVIPEAIDEEVRGIDLNSEISSAPIDRRSPKNEGNLHLNSGRIPSRIDKRRSAKVIPEAIDEEVRGIDLNSEISSAPIDRHSPKNEGNNIHLNSGRIPSLIDKRRSAKVIPEAIDEEEHVLRGIDMNSEISSAPIQRRSQKNEGKNLDLTSARIPADDHLNSRQVHNSSIRLFGVSIKGPSEVPEQRMGVSIKGPSEVPEQRMGVSIKGPSEVPERRKGVSIKGPSEVPEQRKEPKQRKEPEQRKEGTKKISPVPIPIEEGKHGEVKRIGKYLHLEVKRWIDTEKKEDENAMRLYASSGGEGEGQLQLIDQTKGHLASLGWLHCMVKTADKRDRADTRYLLPEDRRKVWRRLKDAVEEELRRHPPDSALPPKKKKVLITGGAGFIGSHLVDKLMASGKYEVIVMDNFTTAYRDNIKQWVGRPHFRLLTHDVTAAFSKKVSAALDGVNEIYHLACPVENVENPVEIMKTNVIGTMNLLELANSARATILLTSSSEVYGEPLPHRQTESDWGVFDPTDVKSCYGEGKRAAEASMFAYHRQHGVDIRIARIFNTYGPRMNVVDGLISLMERGNSTPINIGSSKRDSVSVANHD